MPQLVDLSLGFCYCSWRLKRRPNMIYHRNSIKWTALKAALISMLWVTGVALPSHAAEEKWESLLPAINPETQAVAGTWQIHDQVLSVAPATGGRLLLPVTPASEYDLRVRFSRKTGNRSIGVVVVHQGQQVAFEVDAWAKNLSGFQNIDGRSIQENATRREKMKLENGKFYVLTIEVRNDQLRALLDGEEIAKLATDGKKLSLPDFWKLPTTNQPALLAWENAVDFQAIDIRAVTGSNNIDESKTASTKESATPSTKTDKHVLLVIANGDFFYREYADPRAELERRGIQVTVAAGQKVACRPHANSGQGSDDGVVMPDIALKDVKAEDYDAILFSGGWGASMYQYAFKGSYDKASYNGDASTKAVVNRLISDFVKQDKYVCALCNAVSVLAWARIDGKSPLAGKRVCAPTRQAPSGTYNGRKAQPSCRWHPEQNEAIMSPPGAVGNPNTNLDDVIVDGKIITGEDDPSAREMGRRIADVLLK